MSPSPMSTQPPSSAAPAAPQQQQARPQQAQQQPPAPPVDYHAPRRFVEGSRLRRYLALKKPASGFICRDTSTLNEVLQFLKEIISAERLYDDRNASIVLCDPDLDSALNVKALHLTEIREQVCKQLVEILPGSIIIGGQQQLPRGPQQQQAMTNGARTTTATTANSCRLAGRTVAKLIPLGGHPSVTQTTAAAPPTRATALPATLVPQGTSVPATRVAAAVVAPPAGSILSRPSPTTASLIVVNPRPPPQQHQPPPRVIVPQQQQQQPPVIAAAQPQPPNLITNVTAQSQFTVQPDFRTVLNLVEGVDQQQVVFTYEELTKYLSAYILTNKDKFFDERNIKVAIVGEDDPLGVAFKVRAFHRTQVTSLLRSQLIPYVPGQADVKVKQEFIKQEPTMMQIKREVKEEIKQEPTTCQMLMTTTIKQEVPDIVVKQEPSETTTTTTREATVNQAVICQNVQTTTKESRVRKRSSTLDEGENCDRDVKPGESLSIMAQITSSSSNAAKRSRHRSRKYSIELYIGKQSEEEAYSSAGEETIYSEQGYETVTICSRNDDEDDEDDDDDEEEEVEDFDDFTEYEVDSDAYKQDEDKPGMTSSSEDSDIQDVCIISAAAVLMEETDGTEFWADSESDFELSNFDPELGPRASEVWKCVNCNCPNTPYMRFCHRCWQERKGWVPSRPKPRKRKKNKRTDGIPIKGGAGRTMAPQSKRPALDRSISYPGETGGGGGIEKTLLKGSESAGEEDGEKDVPKSDLAACSSSSQDSGLGGSQELVEDVSPPGSSCSSGASTTSSQEICDEEDVKSVVGDMTERVVSKEASSSSSSSSSSSKKALREMEFRSLRGLTKEFLTVSTTRPELLCNFCLSREKNAGIIHGGIIHQICCYPCAKKLYNKRQPCPMCRRRIEKISKIIVG